MEYAHLGRSGVSVSRLCLGTMNFGAATLDDKALGGLDEIFPGPGGAAARGLRLVISPWSRSVVWCWRDLRA